MGMFNGKFDSHKQDWETPNNLYQIAHARYNFTFDLAANEENTKCDKFFSIKDDALSQEWIGCCWLNPPYGILKEKLSSWVKKAYEESLKETCSVAILIPARTNTKWWHKYCMKAKEILFIEGRPKFKGCKYGLPQPLVIVFFNGNSNLEVKTLSLKEEKIK